MLANLYTEQMRMGVVPAERQRLLRLAESQRSRAGPVVRSLQLPHRLTAELTNSDDERRTAQDDEERNYLEMMTETNHYSNTLLLRRIVLVLVAAIVAALGISVAASGEAQAAGAKVVTKTFTNSPTIQILASGQATPYPSEMNVSGFKRGRIRDVNLYLHSFSHTYPDDVDVMLVGPTGKRATVMSDAGGNFSVSNTILALNDENVDPLPDNSDLSGKFFWQPANYGVSADPFPSPAPASSGESALSVFDGSRPNGTWKLFVVDDASPDGGKINAGWSLEIEARIRR